MEEKCETTAKFKRKRNSEEMASRSICFTKKVMDKTHVRNIPFQKIKIPAYVNLTMFVQFSTYIFGSDK